MPLGIIEEYNEAELTTLYQLLQKESCSYPIDSTEFYVLTKAMSDVRGQM